jgi:hypothetical protein
MCADWPAAWDGWILNAIDRLPEAAPVANHDKPAGPIWTGAPWIGEAVVAEYGEAKARSLLTGCRLVGATRMILLTRTGTAAIDLAKVSAMSCFEIRKSAADDR